MKFLYSESKTKAQKHLSLTASFFFNARGELLEKTIVGMYRSLLLQLFRAFPDLQCVLDDPELLPQVHTGCPSLNSLKDLLRVAISKLGQRSLTCFIDALDECDEQQVMDLVEYFEDLAEQCTEETLDFRICLSSRHYPYIDIKIGIRTVLEGQAGHASDLERYIETHLRIKDRSLLADVKEKMLQKASGIFLWVVLVVNILNKENCRGRLAMKRRLEQIPSGLSDLFKNLLRRDAANMEELQLSVLWILLSERPLRPEEYYHAIWSGLALEGLADIDAPEVSTEDSQDCFERCVISSSKGLAEITKVSEARVQFIHESIRDFLVTDKGLQELWPELGPDWESVGHEKLKLCCYSYFELVATTQKIKACPSINDTFQLETEIYPFLQYACMSVLYHAELAANTIDQQLFLENFKTSIWKRVANALGMSEYPQSAGLLCVLAARGHSSLIRTRLRTDPVNDTFSIGNRYAYPMMMALVEGNKDCAAALLGLASYKKDGIFIAESLQGAAAPLLGSLSWICEHFPSEITRLVSTGWSEPIENGKWDLLKCVTTKRHKVIARWLIDYGGGGMFVEGATKDVPSPHRPQMAPTRRLIYHSMLE